MLHSLVLTASRRGAVACAGLLSIGAVFLQFFSPTHVNGMLLAGKLLNGVSLGMYVSCAASYCAEISPLALRGITTGSVNLWIVIGQFLSNCVIEGTGTRPDAYAYRIPFAIQWIFPVILLIGLPFAPESPWYLIRRGRIEAAARVINHLGRGSVDVDLFVQQIQETIAIEEQNKASTTYLDCFRGANRRRTIIALMVFVLQQSTGVVFVLGFSTYFFQLAGFNDSNSFRLGVGVTAIGIVGNLCALFTVNRFGRRGLFFWGMVACTVINFCVAFSSLPNNNAGNWAAAAFVGISRLVCGLSLTVRPSFTTTPTSVVSGHLGTSSLPKSARPNSAPRRWALGSAPIRSSAQSPTSSFPISSIPTRPTSKAKSVSSLAVWD